MIQNLRGFFLSRKKILFSIAGLLLLFLGRPSLFPMISEVTAICGYCFLWYAASLEPTRKRRFFSIWLLFFLSFVLATFWLSSHPFSYIYVIWILCAAFFSLPFALLSTLLFEKQNSSLQCCSYAAFFTLIEFSFSYIFCGFPFLTSALFFSGNLYSLQLASVIGGNGLAFLVFLTNIFLFRSLQLKKINFILPLLIFIPYMCGGLLFWQRNKEQLAFNAKTPLLSCAIVHMEEIPDIFSPIKRPENLVTSEWLKVFPILSSLTPHSVSLIVLPEGVIPYPAEAPLFFTEDLPTYLKKDPNPLISSLDVTKRIAHYYGSPIVLGLEGREYMEDETFSYNSCFFVSPNYHAAPRYDKQLLLPFGEYIPSEKLRSFLAAYGVHGSFSPGRGPRLFVEKNIKIAPLICYEESFSSYVREAALLSPTLFVGLSNDSWFPSLFFGREHFELARLRTVEAGIPLVRSCNKGISGAIDALGRTVIESDQKQACLTTNISQYNFRSFYTENFFVFIIVLIIISIFI